MKKILSLSPIALTITWIAILTCCVCCSGSINTNVESTNNETKRVSSKVYQNVEYDFDLESHKYIVYAEFDLEKMEYSQTFNVHPSNYYDIKLSEYAYTDEHQIIYNEFFVNTLELFVYHRQ